MFILLRQVNEENWRRYCFHCSVRLRVCLTDCLCVSSKLVNQTVGALKANGSKTVKAAHVLGTVRIWPLKHF